MVTHMKTTIDIADALLVEAKRKAKAENRTLRDVVEDGLRRVLADQPAKQPYTWRPHHFKGNGLQPGQRWDDWEQLRDLIYPDPDDRG